MSRLRFDQLPDAYERARPVLAETLRSLREVLDGGWRWGEQSTTTETVVDTDALPVSVEVPGFVAPPMAVLCLRATEQRTSSGVTASGGAVSWEWRGGALLVHAIDGLAPSTRYDVTLAVMR